MMPQKQEALAARETEVLDEMDSMPVHPSSVGMTGLARAEVDVQIETAKRYPRSVKAALDYALQLATLDVETAEACFYVLPRGGKSIEGPGVRLAEIVATAWGNLRYGAEILGVDDNFIKARGYCFDLQTNTAYAGEVGRRITDSKGRRYNDDMIGVTGQAACAIAGRNAVFKIVPRVYVNRIYEHAKRVAVGDSKTIAQRRQTVMEKYAKRGVTADQVFAKLGVKGPEDITLEHLEQLIGLATAIHEGQTTIDKEFAPVTPAAPAAAATPGPQPTSPIEKLNEVAKKAAQGAPVAAAAEKAKKPGKSAAPSGTSDHEEPPDNPPQDPTLPGVD